MKRIPSVSNASPQSMIESATKALTVALEKRMAMRPAVLIEPLGNSIRLLVESKMPVGEIYLIVKGSGYQLTEPQFRDALAELDIVERQKKTRKAAGSTSRKDGGI